MRSVAASWKKAITSVAGFTLVELMVSMIILAFIFVTMYYFYTTGYRLYAINTREATVLDKYRLVLMQMEQEIADAQKPAATLDPVVVSEVTTSGVFITTCACASSGNELDIYTDINGDGIPEEVVYQLQGNVLDRGVAVTTDTAYPYSYAPILESSYTSVLPTIKILNTDLFTEYSPISATGTGIPITSSPITTLYSSLHNRWQVALHFTLDASVFPLARQLDQRTNLTVRRMVTSQ